LNEQLPSDARCLKCGYPLRGLPSPVCPECGCAFDPADPGSYRGPPLPAFWERYGWPPGWIQLGGAVFVALAFIESQSRMGMAGSPGGMPCCVSLAIAPILLADYAIRFLMLSVRVVHSRREMQPARSPRAWRWWITPICVLVAVSALFNQWPLHARFALSRSAFEEEVRAFRASNPPNKALVAVGGYLGLYYVEDMSRDGTAVHMYVRSAGEQSHLMHDEQITPGPGDRVLSPGWIVCEY